MSSKTKIVVLHMKEIIYTAVFAILAIVFILLLLFMFLPKNKEAAATESKYIPGTYTSTVSLNNTALEVEVSVDESHINSIRFSNLDEPVAESIEEAEAFLEDCMAAVVDNIDEVRDFLDGEGLDVDGMSSEELEEASEVFALPDGRYLIVEG